jgi:hypothetical protein
MGAVSTFLPAPGPPIATRACTPPLPRHHSSASRTSVLGNRAVRKVYGLPTTLDLASPLSFRQLFDRVSCTYTYVLATRGIDPPDGGGDPSIRCRSSTWRPRRAASSRSSGFALAMVLLDTHVRCGPHITGARAALQPPVRASARECDFHARVVGAAGRPAPRGTATRIAFRSALARGLRLDAGPITQLGDVHPTCSTTRAARSPATRCSECAAAGGRTFQEVGRCPPR